TYAVAVRPAVVVIAADEDLGPVPPWRGAGTRPRRPAKIRHLRGQATAARRGGGRRGRGFRRGAGGAGGHGAPWGPGAAGGGAPGGGGRGGAGGCPGASAGCWPSGHPARRSRPSST